MTATNLTSARLRELLTYCPETGVFVWKNCAGRWGKIPAGTAAGSQCSKGYWAIRLDGENFRSNRLAWFFVHGVWPNGQVDHADGNKSNDAIGNLRNASQSENSQNQRHARIDNQSGLLGVSVKGNAYQARITVNQKTRNLGFFDTAELAHAAYLTAKKDMHPFGDVAKTADATTPKRRTFSNRSDRSKSGLPGVGWDGASNKWQASIRINGKQIWLGKFSTPEAAHQKYLQAKQEVEGKHSA